MRWRLSAAVAAVLLSGCTSTQTGSTTGASPDTTSGTASIALNRKANLKRALARLDFERKRLEGRYDDVRIAPGRINTNIEAHGRTFNVQLDAGEATPSVNQDRVPDTDEGDLVGRDIDPAVPEQMLKAINRRRSGNAVRDLDYLVVSRGLIDKDIEWSAYFRSGPRPRAFTLEQGKLKAIG